ncbi:MAG: hypothetical protein JNL32_02135 [Candidatus Kapabacteria bacterium]|nr:hypothetical protein [Candidatus Kapabacteria bacterium]
MNNTLTNTGSIIIFLMLLVCSAQAQNEPKNYVIRTEIGYTSTFLMGLNSAKYPVLSFPDRNSDPALTGSGFFGAQSGISARVNYQFGSTQQYIIPIGIDMTFYRGFHRLENRTDISRASVSSNTFSLIAGFQHRIMKLPLAEGFIYGGIEATGTYNQAPTFTYNFEEKSTGVSTEVSNVTLKEDAFRAGAALRLGVQGNINEPLRINVSCGYGILNLIGRDLRTVSDERRAELLTPNRTQQTQELFVHYLQYSFSLQYTF